MRCDEITRQYIEKKTVLYYNTEELKRRIVIHLVRKWKRRFKMMTATGDRACNTDLIRNLLKNGKKTKVFVYDKICSFEEEIIIG